MQSVHDSSFSAFLESNLLVFFTTILLFVFILYLSDNNNLVSAERINGTPQNDNLTGTPDSDRISGSGGNDTLSGLGGNDEIDGGRGTDTISGAENDTTL